MLQILQKGIQFNAPLNQTGFTGIPTTDVLLPYVQGLVAGRAAALGANGIELADAAQSNVFLGFIINNASGYSPYENLPALASGIIPVTFGNQVVITDQIVAGLTFNLGDKLYLGSGANAGLVTNVVPGAGNTASFGIAGSSASAASPELTVLINS